MSGSRGGRGCPEPPPPWKIKIYKIYIVFKKVIYNFTHHVSRRMCFGVFFDVQRMTIICKKIRYKKISYCLVL